MRNTTPPTLLQNNVRLYRKAAKLSQQQLAILVGATKAQISKLEKGQTRLNDHWIGAISQALGIEAHLLIHSFEDESLPIHGTIPGLVLGLQEPTAKKSTIKLKIKRPGCYVHQIQGEFLNKMVHHLDYVIVDPGQQDKHKLDGKLVVVHVGKRRLSGFLQLSKKGYIDSLESFSTDPMIPKSEELETGWTIEGEVVAFLPKDLV
jgi:transcriptional regulator with XRE-family HTH domain